MTNTKTSAKIKVGDLVIVVHNSGYKFSHKGSIGYVRRVAEWHAQVDFLRLTSPRYYDSSLEGPPIFDNIALSDIVPMCSLARALYSFKSGESADV